MTQVKVTFLIEGDDPDHEMGVSEEMFNELSDQVAAIGGEDVQMEKVDG